MRCGTFLSFPVSAVFFLPSFNLCNVYTVSVSLLYTISNNCSVEPNKVRESTIVLPYSS